MRYLEEEEGYAFQIQEMLSGAAAIAKGMGVTLKEMMNPTLTDLYPDAPPVFQERYRGLHVLQRDENGMEKCVACFLCSAACPAHCIYIEAADNTDQHRISGGERYAKTYNIDYITLHLLRLLRGGLPHRRHHARARLRAGQLQRLDADLPQGKATRSAARRQHRQTVAPEPAVASGDH